jgi:heme exporter protein D
MQWKRVSEFFAMGGYALYVWGGFGLTAVVMVLEGLQIRRQRAELLNNLRSELLSERTPS